MHAGQVYASQCYRFPDGKTWHVYSVVGIEPCYALCKSNDGDVRYIPASELLTVAQKI
jgi:hypothetical protein